jgi:hypothetical protein
LSAPPGWEVTDEGLRREVTASGLEAESLQERLIATARSAGRDVDVVEDSGRLHIRLPNLSEAADAEVAERLNEVLAGGGDTANTD